MMSLSVFVAFAMIAIGSANTIPESAIVPRLVGGHDAVEGQFPYIVSLQTGVLGHFCSGSIISNRWILTAASCVVNRVHGSYHVRVGSNQLNQWGELHEISLIRPNVNFNINTNEHNIALIQTARVIDFTWRVSPISLGTAPVVLDTSVTIPGWGQSSVRPGSVVIEQLQYIQAKTITAKDCLSRYQRNGFLPNVFPTNICTAEQPGVAGLCRGSVGSPVVVNNVLIGIASTHWGCDGIVPDLHTSVSWYNRWIQENTW